MKEDAARSTELAAADDELSSTFTTLTKGFLPAPLIGFCFAPRLFVPSACVPASLQSHHDASCLSRSRRTAGPSTPEQRLFFPQPRCSFHADFPSTTSAQPPHLSLRLTWRPVLPRRPALFSALLSPVPSTCLAAPSSPPVAQPLEHVSATLGLSSGEVQRLLKLCPELRRVDDSSARATLDQLLSAGVDKASLRKGLLKFPNILYADPGDLAAAIDFFTRLGLTPAHLSRMFRSNARMLRHSLERVQRSVDAVKSLGADPVKALAGSMICGLKAETILDRASYFMSIGISKDDVAHWLVIAPSVFALSPDSSLADRLAFLRDEAGLEGSSAALVLSRNPHVLKLTAGNMQRKIDYLRSLGLDGPLLAQTLRRKPQLLTYSLDKIVVAVEFLRTQAGLEGEDLAKTLAGAPSVLGLNPHINLQPKLEFLFEHGYTTPDIVKFPSVLHRSLDNRIRPRVLFLRSLGLHKPFGHFLVSTEERFVTVTCKSSMDAYRSFLLANGLVSLHH